MIRKNQINRKYAEKNHFSSKLLNLGRNKGSYSVSLPMDGKIILLNNREYDHILLLYETGVKVHHALLSFIRGSLKNGEVCLFAYDGARDDPRLETEFRREITSGRLHPFCMTGKNFFYEIKNLNAELQGLWCRIPNDYPTLKVLIDFGDLVTASISKDIIDCVMCLFKKGDEYKTNGTYSIRSMIAFDVNSLPDDALTILLELYKNVMFSTRNEHMTLMPNFRSVEMPNLPSIEIVPRNILERFVKKHLEIIVLSMLLENSMCGYDLIRNIYQKYHTFLSQGTVYPLLYDLQKRDTIKIVNSRSPRSKVYAPTEQGKKEARKRINEFFSAQKYLLEMLRKT